MSRMSLRRRAEPVVRPVLRVWFRTMRSMTLGARVLATAEDGRLVLVRHTYVEGWFLPGGGVERGEKAALSARRELEEEAGVAFAGALDLLGVYANFATFPGDHVLLYRAEGVEPQPRVADREIAEVMWTTPDALPEGTTPATRRRVAEVFFGAPISPDW